MDCFGPNPMKAAYDNCFIRSRLGVDPITGRPMTIWDEQIDREKQILESLGELVILFRQLIIPDKENGINGGKRCPNCYDGIRKQARTSCPICNGFGILKRDPSIPKVGGFEFLRNPERDDNMFYVNQGMTAQKTDSIIDGLNIDHQLSYWTVPIRNCNNNYVNILSDRDVMIRYVFDPETNTPVREIGRYEVINTSFSLTVDNKLMHMKFDVKRVDPGKKNKVYALPNFLS